MSNIFQSNSDIRLELAIVSDTLIILSKNNSINNIRELPDGMTEDLSIVRIVDQKPRELNSIRLEPDQVYLIEDVNDQELKRRITLLFPNDQSINQILGAAYGNDIIITDDSKYFEAILNNKGKFRIVYFLNSSINDIIGKESNDFLSLNESIVASYHGFIDLFKSIPFEETLIQNNGLYSLLFPTDKNIPGETEQSINIILTREEVDELIEGVSNVVVCTIFTDPHFINHLLESMFLLLESVGVFFIENEFIIHSIDLFREYIIDKKYPRLFEVFLRLLISLDTFELIAQHDNFKDFLLQLSEEYNIESDWKYY
jgi:hypothetical protein